jgi:hypothetical protein
MRYDNPQRPAPTRAIIIADTSAIWRLSVELPDKFKTIEARRNNDEITLCKILPFLAQNGYEIIIPEMVAFEAGVARNGVALDDFFDGEKAQSHAILRMRAFYRRISSFPGSIYIAPPPAQDNSPAAAFARAVWKVITSNEHPAAKVSYFVALNKIHTTQGRKNYGDVAAAQFVRFMKKPSLPIFYLSEDLEAAITLSDIRADVNVIQLRISGLYNGMRNNGLLQAVGLTDVAFQHIHEYLSNYVNQEGQHWKTSSTYGRTFSTKDGKVSKDGAVFSDSLTGLQIEIPSPPSEEFNGKVASGVNRFNKRWTGLGKLSQT